VGGRERWTEEDGSQDARIAQPDRKVYGTVGKTMLWNYVSSPEKKKGKDRSRWPNF